MHESYKKWIEDSRPKVFCQCKCGEEIIIKKFHKYNGIPKFINGHQNRGNNHPMYGVHRFGNKNPMWGKKHTEESKNKNSKSHKGLLCGNKNPAKRPEVRKKISLNKLGVPRSDEAIRNMVIGHKGIPPWNKGLNHKTNKRIINGKNSPLYGKPPFRYTKRYYYESPLQGEVCLRYGYELAYAKYLDEHKILWMYEMETFDLGNTTYTPDFFLPQFEKFIEIKGYMTDKAQKKIDMFLEQYPWDLEILRKEDLIKLGIKL